MFEWENLRIYMSMNMFVLSTWDWGSEAAISFNQVVGHCSTTVEIKVMRVGGWRQCEVIFFDNVSLF